MYRLHRLEKFDWSCSEVSTVRVGSAADFTIALWVFIEDMSQSLCSASRGDFRIDTVPVSALLVSCIFFYLANEIQSKIITILTA